MWTSLLFACAGKVGRSFLDDTESAKLHVPEHLLFVSMGW